MYQAVPVSIIEKWCLCWIRFWIWEIVSILTFFRHCLIVSWFLSLMLGTPWERCDPHHRYNRHKYNCHSSSLVMISILIISNIIIVILNYSSIDSPQIISGWNCKGACRLHWQIQMNVLRNQQNYMWRSIRNYKMNSGITYVLFLVPPLSYLRSTNLFEWRLHAIPNTCVFCQTSTFEA